MMDLGHVRNHVLTHYEIIHQIKDLQHRSAFSDRLADAAGDISILGHSPLAMCDFEFANFLVVVQLCKSWYGPVCVRFFKEFEF
jgi:hypothetical protein